MKNGASSNTPRVCIETKSRHTQSSKEQGDTSVEDKLEKGRIGSRAITSELICLRRQVDGWLFEALKWVEIARKGQRIVFLRPSGELMARKK